MFDHHRRHHPCIFLIFLPWTGGRSIAYTLTYVHAVAGGVPLFFFFFFFLFFSFLDILPRISFFLPSLMLPFPFPFPKIEQNNLIVIVN
jgi:hypothetical protein